MGFYFVAPNGDDKNSGGILEPLATLNRADDLMVDGDTCFVRGGRYTNMGPQSLKKSASFEKYPEDDTPPVLDMAAYQDAMQENEQYGIALYGAGAILSGLWITGGWKGFIARADKVMITGSRVTNCGSRGFGIAGHNVTLLGNKAINCGLFWQEQCQDPARYLIGGWPGIIEFLPHYTEKGNCTGGILRGNLVKESYGDGFGIYKAQDALLEYNTVDTNWSEGFYCTASHIVLRYNKAIVRHGGFNRPAGDMSPMDGFKFAREGSGNLLVENVIFEHNVTVGCRYGARWWADPRGRHSYNKIEILNNWFLGNVKSGYNFDPVRPKAPKPYGNVLANNVIERGAEGEFCGDPAGWVIKDNILLPKVEEL